MKTKSLEKIDQQLVDMDESSLRYKILKNTKCFKTSWIELGQALYAVWRDKLYKDWGYGTFDAYTTKEIGIRKQTALKLLRSYYFLEKEEPRCLTREHNEERDASKLPTYESVNELRLANAKKGIDKLDYETIKKNALEKGKDAKDIRKELTSIMKEREELQPEEAWKKKKITLIKRSLSVLNSVKREIQISKILPVRLISQLSDLIQKMQQELPK